MASTAIIRCPVCLASQTIASGYPADKQLHCGNCQRDFPLRNALPVAGGALPTSLMTAQATPASSTLQYDVDESRNPLTTWMIGLVVLVVVITFARPYMATLRGPGFLLFYATAFVCIFIALLLSRALWEDSLHVTLLALLMFEAIGVVRFFDGSAIGMHKFSLMFALMAFGAILMFTRSDKFTGNSSSGGCSTSGSCGSSCSGCGGGGGCGGCGG